MAGLQDLAVLLVCLAGLCGCESGVQEASHLTAQAVGGRRVPRAAADRWLQLVEEYARDGAGAGADANWFPHPIPVSLPIGGGRSAMPVLIVPVPVPAPAARSSQCGTDKLKSDPVNYGYGTYGSQKSSGEPLGGPAVAPVSPTRAVIDTSQPELEASLEGHPPPLAASPPNHPLYREEPSVPQLDFIVSSQQLVELFQKQTTPDPELPPALIPDYTAGEEPADAFVGEDVGASPEARRSRHVRIRRYQLSGQNPQSGAAQLSAMPPVASLAAAPLSPPTPRFDHSLMLRGELTVPRAGYTEPYSVWWDAESGAARVDLHGGATSAYRMLLADGRVQGVEMRVDRSGESEVRRCAVTAPRVPASGDRDLPALPDLEQFSFAGYLEAEFGRVERWTRTVTGNDGEMGGVRGETLTFRHEMLLARAGDNYTTTPLKYSVAVDSSVLGANCDGYVHRYTELRDQKHDAALLRLDLAEACEEVTTTTQRERVEPLREYTLPHRDPRHDTDFMRFKTNHRRQYMDDTEEAVRKTLMMHHSRFVDSGNRQGATFSMEVNHLGDRLDAELSLLRGVRAGEERVAAESFPHSRDQLAAMRTHLPRAFDWRERGAVSHVRNQGSCASCWAFAVAGAVEGALFVRTRRLVPLSEQVLVDCAHPYGGHGCHGTWPSAAYDYIKERGLPALREYTPYKEKVVKCVDRHVAPVTHISSHVNVTRNSVQALKVAIRRHAPTVVLIDSSAKSFAFYKKGVVYDDRCAKNKAEHAVLAVGWGEQRREPHFVIKNSWSAAWGDGGYVRLAAASNTCGVLSKPSYPRLERADVDRVPAGAVAADAGRD